MHIFVNFFKNSKIALRGVGEVWITYNGKSPMPFFFILFDFDAIKVLPFIYKFNYTPILTRSKILGRNKVKYSQYTEETLSFRSYGYINQVYLHCKMIGGHYIRPTRM